MTLVLRDADVRSLIGFPAAIAAVAEGVRDRSAVAERLTMRFPGGWMRVTAGTLPVAGVLGVKAFHLVPGSGVRYLCALYDAGDGEPLALIDANLLTVMRTSAAAAAAAERYWGEQPIRVAVIGTGRLARDGLPALASVCALTRVRVYSPRRESRERYVQDLDPALEVPLEAADTCAEATADADMVLCATETHGVVALEAAHAGPAMYISSVSSTLPSQRELDAATITRAGRVIVDTPDALQESGDMLAASEAGLDRDRVIELVDHLGETPPAREGLTVYKSIGSAEQDLALAAAVWHAAKEQGGGQEIATIEALRPT